VWLTNWHSRTCRCIEVRVLITHCRSSDQDSCYGETCSLPKREMALECSRKSHEASENASSSDSNHSTQTPLSPPTVTTVLRLKN